MLKATTIVGAYNDPSLHAVLHRHEHAGTLEWITIPRADIARRRMRVRSENGTEVAIMLPRTTPLFDGAVIWLDQAAALVVRLEAEDWLRLCPRDSGAALMLGYHAGNLHWRTRFEGNHLLVAVEADRQAKLNRLSDLLSDGAGAAC